MQLEEGGGLRLFIVRKAVCAYGLSSEQEFHVARPSLRFLPQQNALLHLWLCGGKGLRCACTVSSGHQREGFLCPFISDASIKATWRTAEPNLQQAINTASAN